MLAAKPQVSAHRSSRRHLGFHRHTLYLYSESLPVLHHDLSKSTTGYHCGDYHTSMFGSWKLSLRRLTLQLTNRTDLKNLCQVSKGLHQVCLPYLYEGLVLEPSQGRHHLQGINIEPLRLARERGYLSYTRDIEFTAKSNQRGCIHPRHPYIVADKISRSVMPLLEALKDGNLRSLKQVKSYPVLFMSLIWQ
jgi:hypothetical protein